MAFNHRPAIGSQSILFGTMGLLIALLETSGLVNTQLSYILITLLLLYFIGLQVMNVRRLHPQIWLLNPVFQVTFNTFIMGYGVTNVIYFLPPEMIAPFGLVPEVFPAMVEHQYLVLLGALMLFVGYWSSIAARLTAPLAVARFQQRYLPGSEALKWWAIPLLLGISVMARLFSISKGVYGYSNMLDYSEARILETAAYSQYLGMLGSLGKLVLLLAGLRYFSPSAGYNDLYWFRIALLMEVAFGFLSGFKTAVIMPFIIIGVCCYVRRGKVQVRWILISFLAFTVAYAVIEPFRVMYQKRGHAATSVSDISVILQDSVLVESAQTGRDNDSGSAPLKVAARSNLSYIGAFGLEYLDLHKGLPIGSPDFLYNIFMAPIYALIPRFVWDGKPLGAVGLWYTHDILNSPVVTSTAMGIIVNLYFAGGYIAVALFYFCLGVITRLLWFRLMPWKNQPGALVALDLLIVVSSPESSVDGMIISFLREGLILLLVVNLIFKRHSRSAVDPLSFTLEKV